MNSYLYWKAQKIRGKMYKECWFICKGMPKVFFKSTDHWGETTNTASAFSVLNKTWFSVCQFCLTQNTTIKSEFLQQILWTRRPIPYCPPLQTDSRLWPLLCKQQQQYLLWEQPSPRAAALTVQGLCCPLIWWSSVVPISLFLFSLPLGCRWGNLSISCSFIIAE